MFDDRDGEETDDPQLAETVYSGHFAALIEVASQFSIPAADAEELPHQVILSSLHKRAKIADLRSWLVGGMTYAARRVKGIENE